ncbi:gamma-glutamyltransferase [Iamia majanohamensis]|uniref:Gamma-glutamyltransferase n=1 Tax=Iamia majanohamensis TaxID=467976 RepID=A0AAF0BR32_9ACTN|nr:gamma-glutamyltransferase [Iamia majanohamensis]WCO65916.1 gamma-glutamyltransferase [Iamia majanohamensis]
MAATTRPGPSGALVAAGHPAVARAAGQVLAAGGNAFDAVVAAGFAAAVAEPCLSSLAGGGFCLARTAEGEEVLFDFFVDTPGRGRVAAAAPAFDEVVVAFEAATQAFHCGPGSVAVPGCLPGYLHVHRRLGRLPLAEVVGPAAALAAEGVALLPRQAGIVALLEPILLRTAAGRAIFAPEGRLLGPGDVVRNPDQAHLLSELGTGADLTFARGPLADALLAVTAEAGLLTAEDLAAYQVVERTPLEVPWRGRRVLTNPGPSFGGTLVAAALRRLGDDVLVAGDPAAPATLVAAAAEVDRERRAILAGRDPLGAVRPRTSRGTTHVSVWDGEGGAAAMTTSNGECSGDVVAGTGILTNNVLGEEDLHPDGFHVAPPGLRVASMMAPTVVVGEDGSTEVVLGSGGSKRIRSAIAQVLAEVVVHGLDPGDAVGAPRVHWDGDHTEAEPGLSTAATDALARLGPVHTWPGPSVYFGGAHLVVPGVGAAGDPRRDGAALAP